MTRGFIDGFLKTGKFFCASNEECSEDTFSIVNNKLVINIHKDTVYSSKAVELSNFKSKTLDENNITSKCLLNLQNVSLVIFFTTAFVIDLLQDKLELTKLREEIKDLTCETSVNFLWLPKADDVCSSSIAKYFTDAGNSVKLCKNRYQERPEYGLKLPLISDDEFGFLEISEYVGMVLLGCNIEATDFSSYRIPSEHVEIGKGKVIHSKGFIGQQTIQQVIDEVRKILSRNPSIPWIALSIIISANHSKLLLFTNDKIYSL